MNKKLFRWLVLILIFLLILAATILISLITGEIPVSLHDLPGIFSQRGDEMAYLVLTRIRIPRILLAVAVGGGLSLAGVLLQGIFKNPLVEPYTLGI